MTPDKQPLVVVSKVKQMIKAKAGFNTSQETIEVLTEIVTAEINNAIECAKLQGRKTVMRRDFSQKILSNDATR
jgi:histone H3/H4